MQHVWRPGKKVQKAGKKAARGEKSSYTSRQELQSSDSSEDTEESDSPVKEEEPLTAVHRRRLPYFYKRKRGAKQTQQENEGEADKSGWETIDYMLPPLPPGT